MCESKYIGETSRNAHIRGIEHVEEMDSNNKTEQEKSIMLRHINEAHEGRI